jgi:hypothetical protein
MNTQHSCHANAQRERRAEERVNGSSIYCHITTIALGFFVVVALSGAKPASALENSNPCPPERIIYLDGTPICEEIIEVVDTVPYNLRWNLPDARGGGVPTDNGYIPRARDRHTSQRTRPPHHPTKKTPKIKTDKKVTDKVRTECDQHQDRNRFRPPDRDHPDSYVCEFVNTLGNPPGPFWVYETFNLKGADGRLCTRPQTEADRNATIRPSPEVDPSGWDCPTG